MTLCQMKCLQKGWKCIDIRTGQERVGFKRKWEIDVYRNRLDLGIDSSPSQSFRVSVNDLNIVNLLISNVKETILAMGFEFDPFPSLQ